MAQPDHTNPLPSTDNNSKVIFICSVCSNKFSSLHEAQNHPGCWRDNVEKSNEGNGIPKKKSMVEENQQSLDVLEKIGETNLENVAKPSLEVQENVAEPSLEDQEKIAEPSLEVQEKVAKPNLEVQKQVAKPNLEVQDKIAEPNLEVQDKISEPSLEVQEKVAEPSFLVQERVAEYSLEAPDVLVLRRSSGSHFCRLCNSEFKSEESLIRHCKIHEEAAPVVKTHEVATPVVQTHEEVAVPIGRTHEEVAVPVGQTHEEVAVPVVKTHEVTATVSDQTDSEKPGTESKDLYLKIETDQGEICVQLDANDIYNLSEQKVALDLDSIRKSTSTSSTNNSNPCVVTSNTPLTAKLHSVNYKTNYVLDLLQEKLHNKNNTPFLVDADTKVNKPVDKVIDEIIKRNENITTTRKSSTDSSPLHSDVSKNKPVNQIIDEIIQRNENVTRKTLSINSYKPRVYTKPDIDQTVMSLESALPGNIQPGSRLMIGGTTYEILYTSNDEVNTPAVTEATESESNMIYIVDDSGGEMQNAEQSYSLSNMAEVAEINTVNSFDGTVPIGQITNNQPVSQNPVCFVDDIFTVSGDDSTNMAKRGPPTMSSSPQPCKKARTNIENFTQNSSEEVRAFVPAPVVEEEDDVLPEKGSMPDDLYDMIMSHLTEPKPMIFKCNMCHRSFRTEGKLKKHVDFEHKDEPPLTCKVCNTSRTYKSKSALATHLQAHEREEEIAKRLKMNENYQSQEDVSSYICKFTSL